MIHFCSRYEAGELIAQKLIPYQKQNNVVVLALARGGVEVGFEVAKTLSLPLNVIVLRKVAAPHNPELALGCIMEDGECIWNRSIIEYLGVSQDYLDRESQKEKKLAEQRLQVYRKAIPSPDVRDKIVILVDDGIATGATMLVAIQSMQHAKAKRIIVAAPVASTDAFELVKKTADEVICLHHSHDFMSVSAYYDNFPQVEDEEVIRLLCKAKKKND